MGFSVHLYPATSAVVNKPGFRATTFDSLGRRSDTHALDLLSMRSFQPVPIGTMENSIVFRDFIPDMDRRDQPSGVFADSAFIVSVPLPGAPKRIVALHARDASLLHDYGGRSSVSVLFGRERLVATKPSGLVVLHTVTGELQSLDGSGGLSRHVVLSAPALPLRSEWAEATKDSLVAAAENRWQRFAERIGPETAARAIELERRTIEATPVAESLP